eukprot:gb/GFBE01003307.1/.p1 GENE.gb/GFBE01003307.1/~~gb/GFBE01003307.1/.p1  ORF type:complete len:233 (+),score=53.85 gb/GFBE01003307.1/:1-699(+)
MANSEPRLTEAGLEAYCNWLHDTLATFREEHGQDCLQHCNGEVDFSQNDMSNQMVWMLLETLAQHEVHTAILKLTANRISQGGMLALCEFVRANEAEAVRELHLSHNEIDDDSAIELLRNLKTRAGSAGDVPVWVRLNHNRIQNPDQVRRDAEAEGITICNASDRQACSTDKCKESGSKRPPIVHLYSFNVQAIKQPQSPGQLSNEESSPKESEGTDGKGQKRKNKKKGETH